MADVGRAVFQAVANFAQIRREAKRTSRELEDLRDETRDTDRALDDLAEAADDTGDDIHQLGEQAETAERKTRGWARQLVQAAARVTLLTAGVNRLHRAMRSPILLTYAARLRAVGRAADDAYNRLSRFRGLVDSLHARSGRMLGMLAKMTAGLAAVSVASTGVVAGAGGILSLVAAIGAMSGALGLIPAGVGLFAAGIGVLTIGLQGFGDALGAIADGDLPAFEEAVKKLAPSAREVAWALWELRPAFESIKQTVQSRLFAGMADHVRALGAIYLPLLERTLGGVAGAMNEAAHRTMEWLAQAAQIADIDRFLANIEKTAWALVPSAENLTAAFLDLGLVGSELMPRFADEFSRMTGRFRDFMREARDSGRLEEWIRDGVEQLKQLGSIAKSTGGILHAIFTAGSDAGYSFLHTVARAADRLERFLSSVEGQQILEVLFRAAAQAAEALAPVIEELLRTGSRILLVLSDLGERIAPGLEDAIAGLGEAFENAHPGLERLADAVGRFLSALGDNGPLIGEIAEGVTRVLVPALELLAFILETVGRWFESLPEPVQNLIGGFAGAVVVAGALFFVFGKLISALKTARETWRALNLVVDAFRRKSKAAAAANAGAAAVGGGTTVVAGPDAGQSRRKGEAAGKAARTGFLASFGRGLKGGIGLILQGALLAFAFFPGAVGKVASKAKGLFTGGLKGIPPAAGQAGKGAAGRLTTGMAPAAPAAQGLMSRVGAAIKGVGPKATGVASKIGLLRYAFTATPWGLAINGLLLAGTMIWTHWDTITRNVRGAWDGLVGFFQGLGPRIQTAWATTQTWFSTLPEKMGGVVEGIGLWWDKLPGRIGYGLGYAAVKVRDGFVDMRNKMVENTTASVLTVGEWFWKLPGRLNSAAGTASTWVKDRFVDTRDGMINRTIEGVVGTASWFDKLPGRLRGASESAGTSVKNAFRSMRDGGIAHAVGLVAGTVDTVRGIPGKVKGFASGFWDAGKNLMTGLRDGINWMKNRVIESVVNIVVGAVAGGKAAARTGSPSKVFRDIGINIGEGLALGIEQMRNRVLAVVTSLVERLAAAFNRPDLTAGLTAQLRRMGLSAGGPGLAVTPAAPPVSAGSWLAGALPDIGAARSGPDLDGQLAAALRTIRPTSPQTSRDVTVSFGDIVNPLPEPASDTAARKLRTLAAMGAFG